MFFGGGGQGGPFGGMFPQQGAWQPQPQPGMGGSFDPSRLVEQMFAGGFGGFDAGFEQHWPQQQQQQGGQQQNGQRPVAVPTAVRTLRSLPRIKVTNYDIEANESTECSICLDELVVGQPALRIPCGHLYHEACVHDWLKKSNECPVCRYELPTDDAQHEEERRKRMAGRKIRMKHADIEHKTAQELRRLADHIDVDVTGCLEKSEFVERIANSSKVQIIQGDLEPEQGDISSAPGLLIHSAAQLEAMRLDEVHALMIQAKLDFSDCGSDKKEMLRRLVDAGALVVTGLEQNGSQPCDVEMANASGSSEAPAASSDARTFTAPDSRPADVPAADTRPLSSRSVKDLRQMAHSLGCSLEGCLEKGEMVERITAAIDARGRSGPS
jgi:hypothetical protein